MEAGLIQASYLPEGSGELRRTSLFEGDHKDGSSMDGVGDERAKTPRTLPGYDHLSSGSSEAWIGGRLKVRLVRLHLEAEEKAQVRRAQLELEIHCLETEADKGMRLCKLESQPQASSVSAVLPGSTPTLQWPSDIWPLLLQCKLTGKAQKVVATLPLQDSLNYSSVKSAVFQAYELVPEAYRQKFRQQETSLPNIRGVYQGKRDPF